jgi:hypothetical protein
MSNCNIVRREWKLKAYEVSRKGESNKVQPIKTLKLYRIGFVEAGCGGGRILFLREDPDGWRISA